MPGYAKAPDEVRQKVVAYFRLRFGVPARHWKGYTFLLAGDGTVWLTTIEPCLEWGPKQRTMGLRLARLQPGGVKPTTYALQWLGKAIRRSRVVYNDEELSRLLAGEHLPPRQGKVSRGYVALCLEEEGWEEVIGCGFFDGQRVRHQIPKGQLPMLRHALRSLRQWRKSRAGEEALQAPPLPTGVAEMKEVGPGSSQGGVTSGGEEESLQRGHVGEEATHIGEDSLPGVGGEDLRLVDGDASVDDEARMDAFGLRQGEVP